MANAKPDDAAAQPAADTTTDPAAAPTNDTAAAAAADAAPTLPAGDALGWTDAPADGGDQPAPAEPEADVVDELVQATLPLPVSAYVVGLELELVLYADNPERKAAIVEELDRVRGGKAVIDGGQKETR